MPQKFTNPMNGTPSSSTHPHHYRTMAKFLLVSSIACALSLSLHHDAVAQTNNDPSVEENANNTPSDTPTVDVSTDAVQVTATTQPPSTTNAAPDSTNDENVSSDESENEQNQLDDVDVQKEPLKKELEEYWSSEGRELVSVSERIYNKEGTFETSLLVGMEASSPFWWYINLGLRLTYNFTQHYGLELSGSYQLPFKTSLHDYLEQRSGTAFNSDTDLDDKAIFRTDVLFIWRPFYGKFGFFNKKLAHFDFNFAVGAGLNSASRPEVNRQKATTIYQPELTLGAGFSIYITQNWTARFDARSFATLSAKTNTNDTFFKRLYFPVEFSLGAGYVF